VRQFFPELIDPVNPAEVYRDWPVAAGRLPVRLNMIASVDGATTIAGVARGLGNPADRALFILLRRLADVVLVAAGTVRAEGYGPSSVPIAVVSRSCRFDWDAPFFTAQKARPILITVADAPTERVARAAELAEVVVAGDHDVDLALALTALQSMGFRTVLSEGGPTLNGQLVAAGLLDELCLTVSPRMVSGDAKRILAGPVLTPAAELRLHSICEEDGFLFLRYRRRLPRRDGD
jgi:riboflavin biosynthesis pyrimidine reductase